VPFSCLFFTQNSLNRSQNDEEETGLSGSLALVLKYKR